MGLMGPWVISMGPQIQGPSPRTHSAVYVVEIFKDPPNVTEPVRVGNIARIRSLSIVNAVVTGLYTLIITLIGFKLYTEFQWTVYRQLNADWAMQRRYFTFKVRKQRLECHIPSHKLKLIS
jgi:hypothetical protein